MSKETSYYISYQMLWEDVVLSIFNIENMMIRIGEKIVWL